MASDLNFDELDKAVTNYMQKDDSKDETPPAMPAPTSYGPPPVIDPDVHTPEPHKDEPVPVAISTAPTKPEPKPAAPALPRIQVQTRQSLAGRRASRGTFHDIIPARLSPAKPIAHLSPLSESPAGAVTSPSLSSAPSRPSNTASVAPVSTPSAPPPEKTKSVSPETLVKPTATEPVVTPEPEAQIPKILSSHDSAPVVKPPDTAKPAVTLPELVEENQHSNYLPPEEAPLLPSEESARASSALLEDLQKEGERAADVDKSQPTIGFGTKESLSHHPIDFADTPDEPVHPTTGLLDTGELHAALPSHAATTLPDNHEQPVFDTKEYHTPITAGAVQPPVAKTSHGKMWEWVIIILLIVVAVAAGVVAYMMLFKG